MTHTPTPWFVAGVRFRMNGGNWLSINRYDDSKKQDENIACVGYDPRNGLGQADAAFIVKAVNNHDALVDALLSLDTLLDFGDDALENVWTFDDMTSIQAAFDKAKAALDQVTSTDLIAPRD